MNCLRYSAIEKRFNLGEHELTNKIKYTIGALSILILILVQVTEGCSRSATSSITPVVSTTAGNTTPPGALSQRRTATGAIDSVNDNTLMLTNPQSGKINVSINPSTMIEKAVISQISDLKTGNYLTITGQPDSSGTVMAAAITVRAAAPTGMNAPPIAGSGSATPTSGISGTLVSSINNVLTLTTAQGTQTKVTINSESIIEKYENAASSDLFAGRLINVSGTADASGNIAAITITIQAVKPIAASPTHGPVIKPTTPVTATNPVGSSETTLPVFSPSPIPSVPNIDGPPIILIITPSAESVIPAGDLTVTSVVSNFNLVPPTGQPNKNGEGHIIYYLDGVPLKVPTQSAFSPTGTYAKSVMTSYSWQAIKVGYHSLSVQLVNNDDTPLVPAITNTIYVIAR
jgi:hypothetical protein